MSLVVKSYASHLLSFWEISENLTFLVIIIIIIIIIITVVITPILNASNLDNYLVVGCTTGIRYYSYFQPVSRSTDSE